MRYRVGHESTQGQHAEAQANWCVGCRSVNVELGRGQLLMPRVGT